jgi:hypothetical protein
MFFFTSGPTSCIAPIPRKQVLKNNLKHVDTGDRCNVHLMKVSMNFASFDSSPQNITAFLYNLS